MKELLAYLNFDPQTRTGIMNITVWLAMLAYLLFLGIFVIPTTVPKQPEDYALYFFVLFVPSAVRLVFFSNDPIQYNDDEEARFFRSQQPSQYVAEKWNLPRYTALDLWFKAFRRKEEEEIGITYQYGFTCRLVYFTWRITAFFAALALVWFVFQIAVAPAAPYQNLLWCDAKRLLAKLTGVPNWRGKLMYLIHVSAIAFYMKTANKPDAKAPTGIWALWRDINRQHRAWIDEFETIEKFRAYAAQPLKPQDKPENKDKPRFFA